MKTLFASSVLIVSTLFTIAQTVSYDPPGISWKKSDELGSFPAGANPATTPITGISEDWWYDHKNSYNNGIVSDNNFNGFVTCGYSGIANIEYTENEDGCISVTIEDDVDPDRCNDELDFFNFPEGVYNRAYYQTIGRYDPHGNLLWYYAYNGGYLIRVIQSSDGNYIAVGATSSTRAPDMSTPLYYNPGQNGWYNGFGLSSPFLACPSEQKINVIKISPEGEVIWNYLYGINDIYTSGYGDDKYYPWDLVEYDIGTSESKIRIVGEAKMSSGAESAFMLDIDEDDGAYNWAEEFPAYHDERGFYAIEKYMSNNGEVLAVVGTDKFITQSSPYQFDQYLEVLYFDNTTSHSETWIYQYGTLNGGTYDRALALDLCFNSNGDILVPTIYDCNWCDYDGRDTYGEAAVLLIDQTNGQILDGYPITDGTGYFDLIHAYDLKIGITNTVDGGFAIVTSKLDESYASAYGGDVSWDCGSSANADLAYWNADALVRKFNNDGTIQWTKTFDIDDEDPAPYPGDQKRQECLYSISETPDGGIVVSGNNSRNFDDSYLVKLYDNCNNEQAYDFSISQGSNEIIDISTLGTNVITTDLKIKGSIVIHDQEILQINSKIEFADTRKCGVVTNIVVEYGGTLILGDNAILTSLDDDCPYSMWDGVQMWGDNTIDQCCGNGTQPNLIMSGFNATIKNARYGIIADKLNHSTHENYIFPNECFIKDLMPDETQEKGGGYIYASGATFLNCRFSVVMNAFPDYTNSSLIEQCDFTLDNSIRDFDAIDIDGNRKGINAYIKLFDVHGVGIEQNYFSITTALIPDDRGTAVGAFDSNFDMTDNRFENLYTGLAAGASNPLNTFTAYCNQMYGMVRGMEINDIDYAEIVHNTIEVSEVNAHLPFAIYLGNCTDYRIDLNTLQCAITAEIPGIVDYFQTSNSNINLINNNTFDNFYYSAILEGEHVYNGSTNIGLVLSCNDYNNYQFAESVTLSPGIAGDQNISGGNGANNLFESFGCYPSYGELYNPTGMNSITYYHKNDVTASGWYLALQSGCYNTGQVAQSTVLGTFNYSTDCPPAYYDCSAHLRISSPLVVTRTPYEILADDSASVTERRLAVNEIVRSYLHDSSGNSKFDSIISILTRNCTNGREYQIHSALAKMDSVNLSGALTSIMSNLTNNSSFDRYLRIQELKDTVQWSQMLESKIVYEYLDSIALDSSLYGYGSIRNILSFLYGTKFDPVIILPELNTLRKGVKNSIEMQINVYPIPFTDLINIDSNGENMQIIELYSATGNKIMVKNVNNLRSYQLNCTNLPSGIYMLRVIYQDNNSYTTKLNHLN